LREEIELTKAELIGAVADRTKLTKKDSEIAITAVIYSITEALTNGDSVSLVGFGTVEVKNRAARQGVNPRTKEMMPIAASVLPTFRASKTLKEAVSN
jgi:DNA-binding protein HU-beta